MACVHSEMAASASQAITQTTEQLDQQNQQEEEEDPNHPPLNYQSMPHPPTHPVVQQQTSQSASSPQELQEPSQHQDTMMGQYLLSKDKEIRILRETAVRALKDREEVQKKGGGCDAEIARAGAAEGKAVEGGT